MAIKLQILICTFGEKLRTIDTLGMPRLDGVQYLICCQNPDGLDLHETADALAERGDIAVLFFNDSGLSRNRNHSIGAATAPYILISDDDISYNAAGLRRVVGIFDNEPHTDIITTPSVIDGSEPETHIYPPDGHDLAVGYRFYTPISFEIALRRSAVEKHGLRFSTLAGIGAPYLTAGEENLFFIKAIRKGLKGRFADTVVSTHRGNTTCSHSAAKPGVIRAKGAVMRISRGFFGALIRLPLEAARSRAPFFKASAYLLQGFVYSIKHRHEL